MPIFKQVNTLWRFHSSVIPICILLHWFCIRNEQYRWMEFIMNCINIEPAFIRENLIIAYEDFLIFQALSFLIPGISTVLDPCYNIMSLCLNCEWWDFISVHITEDIQYYLPGCERKPSLSSGRRVTGDSTEPEEHESRRCESIKLKTCRRRERDTYPTTKQTSRKRKIKPKSSL